MKWFKHAATANMDAKLQEVLLDYGLEGYGLYWYCLELIAGNVDVDNLTFELEHDCRIIARNTGATVQRVQEMMKSFVQHGLFENTEGTITCLKLGKLSDEYTTKLVRKRQRALVVSGKNADETLKAPDHVRTNTEQTPDKIQKSPSRLDKKRLDKKRLDKKKQDKTIVAAEVAPVASHEFPFTLPLTGSQWYRISASNIETWTDLYPAVDVIQALRNMYGWLDANPAKRKTAQGVKRFITNWLAKEQNKGGIVQSRQRQTTIEKLTDRSWDEQQLNY